MLAIHTHFRSQTVLKVIIFYLKIKLKTRYNSRTHQVHSTNSSVVRYAHHPITGPKVDICPITFHCSLSQSVPFVTMSKTVVQAVRAFIKSIRPLEKHYFKAENIP